MSAKNAVREVAADVKAVAKVGLEEKKKEQGTYAQYRIKIAAGAFDDTDIVQECTLPGFIVCVKVAALQPLRL